VPFKELSARSQSVLSQLKSLQKLVLSKCSVDPAVLSALTQLTYLKLASLDVSTECDDRDHANDSEQFAEHDNIAGLQQASIATNGSRPPARRDTEGDLLAMLSNLTRLRHLELSDVYVAWPSAPPLAALTALFASSQLQHIELEDQHLPAGALQHALAGAQQLPHVTVLHIGSAGGDALDSASIAALVSRMRALQSCSMRIAAGAQLAALSQLPALRTLAAHAYGSTLAAAATALTHLDVLSIYCHDGGLGFEQSAAAGISSEHLVALTALRQLRTLQFETHQWHVPLTSRRWFGRFIDERHLRLNLHSQVRFTVPNRH
jgi:hypothetical protein